MLCGPELQKLRHPSAVPVLSAGIVEVVVVPVLVVVVPVDVVLLAVDVVVVAVVVVEISQSVGVRGQEHGPLFPLTHVPDPV